MASLVVGLIALPFLAACAHQGGSAVNIAQLPPFQHGQGEISPLAALAQARSPDMLTLTPEMRDFVDRYAKRGNPRQKLITLHQSLRSPAMLDIRYEFSADGTAAQAFNSGTANCLSYAHLFVAMARYAGLEANYQSLTLRPEWARHGDQIALRRHVNVRVDVRGGARFMVDLDPVPRDRVAAADLLSDTEAVALYHANLAMNALLAQDQRTAFVHGLRAVDLAPEIDYLWVNLGAIYRHSGQYAAAEQLYQTALEVNPDSRQAMNNLAVLYSVQGDLERSRLWEEKVHRHRQRNPYYHYHLGEVAERAGDLDTALQHFLDAIALKDSDAEFYFRVAQVYHAQHHHEQSLRYAEEAIQRARLVGERQEYRDFMRKLNEDTVAYSESS